MLNIVEISWNLCEKGVESPIVAEVDGNESQECRSCHDGKERRKREFRSFISRWDVRNNVLLLILKHIIITFEKPLNVIAYSNQIPKVLLCFD